VTNRGDDRLIPLVRWCFTPLAALTAVFGPLLFLLPGSTEDYWSWPIRPDMSAVWVGVAYTFGAIAITTMLVTGRWRSTMVPVASTWPFSIVMLAATLIHQDKFFTDSVRYYVWLIVYIILPFALPAMFWLNRSHDPGRQADDLLLSHRVRRLLALGGGIAAVLGVGLVFNFDWFTDAWPWQLTPLMAMVVGGWLLFLATGGLATAMEPRYIAYRVYLPSAAFWFCLLFVTSLVHLGDFDDGLATPVYFVAVAGSAALLLAIFLRMERALAPGLRPLPAEAS
jgi:hypothetical protein